MSIQNQVKSSVMQEMVEFSLGRKLICEAMGTALLLAAIVGSGIMGDNLSGGSEGLALLANSLSVGAALTVLILIFGPSSGAHFNPAVTLAFLINRKMKFGHAVLYVAVQVVGAILGVMIAHLMFELPLVVASPNIRTGSGMWISEGIATMGLVLTILATIKYRPDAVPYAVGLFIFSAFWFTASTSFANPAVTIGRTLTDTFTGIRPVDAPAFIVAELAAAAAVTIFWRWLIGSRERKA